MELADSLEERSRCTDLKWRRSPEQPDDMMSGTLHTGKHISVSLAVNGASYHGDCGMESRDLGPLKGGSGMEKDACLLQHCLAFSLFFLIKQLRKEELRANAVTAGWGWGGGALLRMGCKAISAAVKTNALSPQQRECARRAKVPESKTARGLLKARPSGPRRVKCKHQALDAARPTWAVICCGTETMFVRKNSH